MSLRLSHRAVCRLALAVACVAAVVGTATRGLAVDYTWGSATTGGSWSVTTNWNPTGAPTSGDTATLADATTNRTVFYNSAASGSLTGLTFTQTTSGILNELRVQRNLAVTNALVLGASSGTARLNITGTSAANITGTFSGGITVNSGGVLALANFNPSGTSAIFNANLTGNVTVSGGRLDFSWDRVGTATSSASQTQTITGNLTMSSGTIAFDNPLGTSPDRRLQITGDVSITGGRFTTTATAGLSNIRFEGASTVFAPASYDSARFQLGLQRAGNQTYSGSTAVLGNMLLRGTGIKTVSNSGTISTLSLNDESATGRTATTLKLGSNLTVGSGGLVRGGLGETGATTLDFGVDADIYTLDLTAATGAWTPTTATGTVAQWALTGTAGRIIANGFNLATANVGTTVGPGLILESRAGNSVANNLSLGTSGTGAIDATSVFRYAGAAAVATPSTLTSSRAIGDLEVTSGALRISSLAGLQNLRVTGGTLDLGNQSLSVTSGSFGGGSVTSGTLTSTTFLATSGSVAASLAGVGGTLTKTTAGTFTLSGNNTYTGTTTLSGGVLQVNSSDALAGGGSLTFSGGTLQYTANNTADYASRIVSSGSAISVDTNSQSVTWAGNVASTNSGGLTKLGSGTLTLSVANSYAGDTTVSAGTLLAGNASALGSASANLFVSGGVLDLGSNSITRSGTVRFAGGTVQSGTLTNNTVAYDAQSGTVTAGLAGSAGLTKTTTGTLVLSASNTYTGPSTVSAGTLRLDNASALGDTTNALAVNGGTLDLNGNSVSVGPLSGASGAVITTANAAGTATLTTSVAAGSSTFGGVIQDNGSGRVALTKLGSGTLALAAVNTFTGTTSVGAGTLQVGVSGTAGRLTGDTVVNTGGRLLLANVSGALGNVAVAGGRFDLTAGNASINGLSMTSGTVGLGNSTLRLSVFGNSSITGGSVVEPGTGGVINFSGATNVFAPQAFNTAYTFQLQASGNQTFSGSTALGTVNLRGTGIKTVSNSGTINTINFVNDTAGSPVTLKLASNLTVGAGGMNLAGFSQQGTALAFGVDADTYTLDLSAASGAWTPGTGGTGTTALWALTGTAGRIIANGFNLGSARVDSSVGPGLILESRAGNGVANTLSVGAGSGTINATSVFRYAGAADVATPSTLTSSRAIGDLEVTSGALRISSLAGLQNLRVTGGTLDLGNQSLSVTSGSFGGGSVTSGTLTSTTFLATSGSVAASLAGVGGTLTKTGAGTFTLAGVNTYTGATAVNAGTLFVNGDQSAAIGAVTVASAATLGGSGTIGGAVSILGGGIVAPGTSPGTLTVANSFTLADASILSFELDAQNTAIGGGINDLITGVTNLTLDGILNITGSGDWTTVADNTAWRLFNYSGSLVDNGLVLGSTPTLAAGQSFQIDTATVGQVNIVVVPEPGALALAGIGIAVAAILRRRK